MPIFPILFKHLALLTDKKSLVLYIFCVGPATGPIKGEFVINKDNSTIKDEITRIFTEIQRIEAQIEANESFVIREILAKHIGDELATQREVNLYRLDIDRYLEKASGGIAVDESPWQLSSESDDDRAAEAAPSSFEATQCLFSAIGAVTGSTVIKIENERKRSVSPDPAVQDPEITHQDKKLHL